MPAVVQAVVVTDPFLIADVLGRSNEVEKSVETVYSKFNVVGPALLTVKARGMLCQVSAPICSTWFTVHTESAHE